MIINDVLIVGNYNVGNFGDDLLLQSCLQNLHTKNVKVLSPNNSDFTTYPAGFRSVFNLKRYLSPVIAISRSRNVLFGGGGIFNSDNFYSFLIWIPILITSIVLRKNIYLFGHSFSSKPGYLLTFLLNKVNWITCRDIRSLSFLESAGLNNTSLNKDLALELKFEPIKKSIQKYLLVNYRTYKNINLDVIKKLDYKLQQKAKDLNLSILYCAFDYELDSQIFKDLDHKYILAKDLEDFLPHIKYFACMRLHACLYSLKNNIHGVALSYASKVKGLLETYDFENIVDLQESNLDLNNLDFNDKLINFNLVSDNPWNIINY